MRKIGEEFSREEIVEYIEDLFRGHGSRLYHLKLCREKLAYKRGIDLGAQATKKKQKGYRDNDPSIDLLQSAINLGHKVSEVRAILRNLNKEERRFVEYRYFRKWGMDKVAEKLHRSKTSVYESIRKAVIEKATAILFISVNNPEMKDKISRIYAVEANGIWGLFNPFARH